MRKRILLLVVIITTGVAIWAMLRFAVPKWRRQSVSNLSNVTRNADADLWAEAIEKVKADRYEPAGGNAAVDTPPELRHYSDRHWFLATQVAEIEKYNVQTCQDYIDLAAMLKRGEIVALRAVTDTYVLYGVGAKADDRVFTRYEDVHPIELYNDTQLAEAYKNINDKQSNLRAEIASLRVQLGKLKKRERTKQKELQKQITALQQELKTTNEEKARLDQFYGRPDSRRKLFRDYDSLQALAKNFGGHSYNLEDPSDRQAMKINMLRSLRPEALRILEELASAYHRQFDRPLPVSSLVRPEEYQHALNRSNRNAVLIETPPHTTGLAFDIDYRFMSATEQAFLMAELARLKNEGRIEAIRERNANYHVFAFINGTRPSDELIAASLDKATLGDHEAHHAARKVANVKNKSGTAKARRPRSNIRANRSRRG